MDMVGGSSVQNSEASVFVGTVVALDFAWLIADTLNALMAIPNLISLLLLTPVVVRLTGEYLAHGGHKVPVTSR